MLTQLHIDIKLLPNTMFNTVLSGLEQSRDYQKAEEDFTSHYFNHTATVRDQMQEEIQQHA